MPPGCPTLDGHDDGSIAFLFDAVDLGMDYAKLDADGFVPLATILGEDGSKHILKLIGDDDQPWSQEQSVALGREKLRDLDEDARCVTLIYDGYFTGDGDRTEAVFVEGYQLGREFGVLMCQRYERRGDEVALIGNPMLLDDEREPLVSADRKPVEYPNLGPEAKRFMLDTIGVGIEDVEPEAIIMVPFAAVEGLDGTRDMWRLVDDEENPTVGGGLDFGHEQLATLNPEVVRCAALVWGGDFPDDENEEGAVFIEVYELGRPAGLQLVQPYRRLDHDRVARLGDPEIMEETQPLVPPREPARSAAFARLQEIAAQKRG